MGGCAAVACTSYTAMPTLVERLSDRTCGDTIGIADEPIAIPLVNVRRQAAGLAAEDQHDIIARAERRSQNIRVAFVEKKYGSPSAGSSRSNASQSGQTRRSTCSQ